MKTDKFVLTCIIDNLLLLNDVYHDVFDVTCVMGGVTYQSVIDVILLYIKSHLRKLRNSFWYAIDISFSVMWVIHYPRLPFEG